jgi:hypothetical protein
MTVMLQRGAPLTPHVTAALGGLAAAGIGNCGVRVIHPEDVSIMLVVWHIGERLSRTPCAFFVSKRPFKARAATDSTSTAVKCEVIKSSSRVRPENNASKTGVPFSVL